MSTVLSRGGNISLQSAVVAEQGRLLISLCYSGDSLERPSVDAVAFLLGEDGKVRGDADMIFYNQKASPGDGIKMLDAQRGDTATVQTFALDVSRLPAGTGKIAFCLVADGSAIQHMGQLSDIEIRVAGGGSKAPIASGALPTAMSVEAALIMGEIYLRNGEWKFKLIGQGFRDGLAALSESYGIVVAQDAQASAPSMASRPLAAAALQNGPPAQVYTPPPGGFKEFRINLTWKAPPAEPEPEEPVRKGFLGNLVANKLPRKKPQGLDLDLCCLYELTDGYRGVVQALGDNHGSFNMAPFMELMGDARAGGDSEGEIIRINGARWNEVTRVLIYAMIFEGTPNWGQASARCTLRVPDEMPLAAKLEYDHTDKRACTALLLENAGGKLAVHKKVEAFRNPREIDDFYQWGLRWSAGMKD
jgi:tellurite resistance protein TerA